MIPLTYEDIKDDPPIPDPEEEIPYLEDAILQCINPAIVLSSETKREIVRQVCNKTYTPGNPPCLKCGTITDFISEYAKDHFSFFCKKCKEWRYIP